LVDKNLVQEQYHFVEHLYSLSRFLFAGGYPLQVLSAFGGCGLSASIPARFYRKSLFNFFICPIKE
jgi:hypothetical protein